MSKQVMDFLTVFAVGVFVLCCVVFCSDAHADTITITHPATYEDGAVISVDDIDKYNVCASNNDPNVCDDLFDVVVAGDVASMQRDGLLSMRYVRARTVMKTGVVSDWSKLAFIGVEPTQIYLKPASPTIIIVE